MIGMIVALFAFTLTVLGGVAGMLARQTRVMDARLATLDADVAGIKEELVGIKVAIARLEGPFPHFQRP
ncbi:hypothetical protein [Humibacter soli]